MKTEHKFALALKTMMAEKSLDEISVLSLCKRCKVNRQTFYYHFHDIYDLLALLFLDEKIPELQHVTNHKQLLETIFNYYLKNQKFLDAVLASAGRDLFQEFLYNSCHEATLKFINSKPEGSLLTSNDKKNIARFEASAFSSLITHYLANTKKKTLKGLFSTFSFLTYKELEICVRKVAKEKDKGDVI